MKSIILLSLIIAATAAFTRYSALVADEEATLALLEQEIDAARAPLPVPDVAAVPEMMIAAPAPQALSPVQFQQEMTAMTIAQTHDVLQLLERKIEYLEIQQNDYVTCAPALGKVVRLSFSIEPPIEGLDPVSVVTSKQAYSIFAQLESESGKFAVASGGDLQLIGARQSLLKLNFDLSVETRRFVEGETEKKGRSNGQGSTIIGLGQKQELLTVGGSKLMVEVKEVIVEEVRPAKVE